MRSRKPVPLTAQQDARHLVSELRGAVAHFTSLETVLAAVGEEERLWLWSVLKTAKQLRERPAPEEL
ncbi:MAG: hypothetical protein ACK47B_09160 [Armatimonadota bacterium]